MKQHGQALVEYVCVLAILIAALCLPVFGERAIVIQLEASIRQFWQAWCASLLSLAIAP